jgi:hypothetical protein
MARAYGSSAHLLMKRETSYGQAAIGNYIRMPYSLQPGQRAGHDRSRAGRRGLVAG